MTYRNGPALLNSAAEGPTERFERMAVAFLKETGMMAPGKDVPAAGWQPPYEERQAAWLRWRAQQREAPRVGGTIEDETGWWQIMHVEDGWVWLLGRDGVERQVAIGNLGHVTYEGDA